MSVASLLKHTADHCIPRFTLTPQRMRMIVEAFKDALEIGLAKPGQIVVRLNLSRQIGVSVF